MLNKQQTNKNTHIEEEEEEEEEEESERKNVFKKYNLCNIFLIHTHTDTNKYRSKHQQRNKEQNKPTTLYKAKQNILLVSGQRTCRF